MTHQRSTPGGKTANATHGDNQPRRRGLPGGQSMHDNFERMNVEQENKIISRAVVLAIAALVGLAIALPSPF